MPSLTVQRADTLQETAYLLRSPANAKHLIKSIESLRQGKAEAKPLIETGE